MRTLAALLTVLLALTSGPTGIATGTADAPQLGWQVVSERPHDATAFTQGLQLDGGRLYESTGGLGTSTLRELDPDDGAILRLRSLPDDVFGEGLALVDDQLVQLSWQNGIAVIWDAATLAEEGTHRYDGVGWGLCFDGERLVMSDGSDQLTFRDPDTFEVLGTVAVTRDGVPVRRLNELECALGAVWANIWMTDRIVRIDPTDGKVSGWLDLSGILEPHPADADGAAVLDGIAYDEAADTFLVTGKRWPSLFEIRVSEPS
jgi:glutamine cyclotransferase